MNKKKMRVKNPTQRDLATASEEYEEPSFYFMQPDTANIKRPTGNTPEQTETELPSCHKTRFDHTKAFLDNMAIIHRNFKGTPYKWEKFWKKALKKAF
jgi:hypothetical protein